MSIYLEIYTVAPAPSRDYYGIKVFTTEIKFYYWRISYGPHKYPGVITINFNEWNEKSEDIGAIFGKSTVDCINKIVNKKYLLTLPINFIINLLKYLSINDLKNFCSVSRFTYQLIKDQVVKELINKKLKVNNKNNKLLEAMAYRWDGLSRETEAIDKQLHKTPRIKGSSDNNSYQNPLKPQIEKTRSVSWTKNIRTSVSDNSIKSRPFNLPEKRVNIINVPSLGEIMSKNILVDASKETNGNSMKLKDKIKTKSREFKFLASNRNINPDLTSDLSRLKANDVDLDALVKKTMDEYTKSKDLTNCKFSWIDDMETPRSAKSKMDTFDPVVDNLNKVGSSKSSMDFTISRLISAVNAEDEFDGQVDKMTPWELVKIRGFKSRESKPRNSEFKFRSHLSESIKKNSRRKNN